MINKERKILAMECAEALNLKPIPPILYEYGIKFSDIPNVNEDGYNVGLSEQSLLSMGVVYSYGSMLTFVDIAGDSYYLPYNEVIINELKKCGYVVCEYGKASPDFNTPTYSEYIMSQTDSSEYEELLPLEREEKERERITLPKELAEKVMDLEQKYNMQGYEKYSYDVFDSGLYRGYQPGHASVMKSVEFLGYDNPMARRYMALTGYACTSISSTIKTATNLKDIILMTAGHPILNDDIYFGKGGLYAEITGSRER